MTAMLVAPETDLQVALRRLDQAMLHICLLDPPLTSEQRHPIRNDLTAVYAALLTLTRTGAP